MADQVTLEWKSWRLGDEIGDGGFGFVREAISGEEVAAAKFVPIEPGAERELLFQNLAGRPNVIPIIDKGRSGDYWVIVMPRANKSLAAHIEENNGQLPLSEALTVLRDVATALAGIKNEVVHRDLKPANVLLLHAKWCLSDFGIARYAEQSTDPHTRKYAGTPAYTAPERWRSERATTASDMYSLGAMGYELICGQPPFQGPDIPDFREQHLEETPPMLAGVPASLESLLRACLHKAPQARPTPESFLTRLNRVVNEQPSPGLLRLQQAHQAHVHRQSEEAARTERARSETLRRSQLSDAALEEFRQVSDELLETVRHAAPDATFNASLGGGWSATMNGAVLRIGSVHRTGAGCWQGWAAPNFEVFAHSEISVRNRPGIQYKGKAHSLWYCDAKTAGEFHWYETAFMDQALMTRVTTELQPDSFDPGVAAANALSRALAEYQVAWPFTELVPGDLREFIDQWCEWFAEAADRGLPYPHRLPEHDAGSWR